MALVGTRSDGQAFEVRGVTLFEVTDDQVVAGRLYMEDVEQDVTGIEQAVEALSGRRPWPGVAEDGAALPASRGPGVGARELVPAYLPRSAR